ncbi:MAG: MFS transporter [Candidatus Heimdallarchaeota archaeon]|nr:MFS transporter [Candidatus Heimdallarchaeota archaeon]MCK5048664.1 MFS transporter [Candidatus Heimdallarchaeota archaeon]
MSQPKLLPLYVSVFLWHVAQSLILPFASLWLWEELETDSFFLLGIFLSLPTLISITGIISLTILTDKRAHFRETIIVINSVGLIQYLFLTQITEAYQYLIIIGIGSLIAPAYFTVILALATNICEVEKKGRVTNNLSLYASAGWFVGSLVAGNGFEYLGMQFMLFIAALFIMISGVMVLLSEDSKHLEQKEQLELSIQENHKGEEHKLARDEEITSQKDQSKEVNVKTKENPFPQGKLDSSLWSIAKRKQISYLLISLFIIDFSCGSFFTFGSIFLKEKANFTSQLIGYSNAGATISAVFILWFLGPFTDRAGRRKVYRIGLSIYPVFFILLSMFHQTTIVFILWTIPLYAFLRPTLSTIISDLTLPHERSRGLSLVMATSAIAITLGAVVGGLIIDNSSLGLDAATMLPAVVAWLGVIIGFKVKESLYIQH